MAEEERGRYIVGPLGIWPFFVLNALLMFVERLRSMRYDAPQPKRPKVYEFVRDEKGRIIQIVEWEAGG